MSCASFERAINVGLKVCGRREASLLVDHLFWRRRESRSEESLLSIAHFDVAQEEWLLVLVWKELRSNREGSCVPYADRAGGNLGSGRLPSKTRPKSARQASRPSTSSGTRSRPCSSRPYSAANRPASAMSRSSPEGGKKFPWLAEQRPWSPSVFAGSGATVDIAACLRDSPHELPIGEKAFKFPLRTTLLDQPRVAQLGSTSREHAVEDRWLDLTKECCPPSRGEMKPYLGRPRLRAWWPHEGERKQAGQSQPRPAETRFRCHPVRQSRPTAAEIRYLRTCHDHR